jgi:hypothetical protein
VVATAGVGASVAAGAGSLLPQAVMEIMRTATTANTVNLFILFLLNFYLSLKRRYQYKSKRTANQLPNGIFDDVYKMYVYGFDILLTRRGNS